jgi:hypothetical protein
LSFEPTQEIAAYWDGQVFQPCDLHQINNKKGVVIEEKSLFFATPHHGCYGHAMLDGILPLYSILKKHNLLNEPINLIVKTDSGLKTQSSFVNTLQLIKDVFHFNKIIFLDPSKGTKGKNRIYFKHLIKNESTPLPNQEFLYFAFYREFPQSFEHIYELKKRGLDENTVYKSTHVEQNLVDEWVTLIQDVYKLNCPMKQNRILIPERKFGRKILNQKALVRALRAEGYEVVVVDFENLSIKEQILEVMQAEYLIGTYGSNLANAIFLHPEANVVILWHKYAKYYWSRRYCIIHSAFLSRGIKLIEFDKPEYDPRDVYYEPIHVPEYFFSVNKMNILRPEMINIDSLIAYPVSMYELLNVDLYIEPADLIKRLDQAKSKTR